MRDYAPVILFVYNRPELVKKTLSLLLKNAEAPQSRLIVFSDGPKNNADRDAVSEVRNFLHTLSGFGQLEIRESESNHGLAPSIISGVTEIVNTCGRVIVLEDDLLPAPFFLRYMNDALDLYRDDENVASVCGYSYPLEPFSSTTFFLKGADCWGWGTWKRAWDLFRPDTESLIAEILSKRMAFRINRERGYDLFGMLCAQRDGFVSSWAVRWDAALMLADKYTLYPARPLISCAGYGSGTHCMTQKYSRDSFDEKMVRLEKLSVEQDPEILKRYQIYMEKRLGKSFFERMKTLLRPYCDPLIRGIRRGPWSIEK